MIRATNVKRGRISAEGLIRIKREAIPESRRAFLKPGDIIVVRSGAYTGDVAMITKEWDGSVAGYDLVVSPVEEVNPTFCSFNLLGDAVQAYFSAQSARSAQPHLNRHQLESAEIPLPPLDEQRKIAGVLELVQRAMEQHKRLVALTTELKKALLHQLFSQGLHGEPQKQTEIGLMPQTWDVVELGDVIAQSPKNGLYKHNDSYGSGTFILRINDFSNDGDEVITASNRVAIDPTETALYALREGDMVTNRVNSLSHLGKTALIGRLIEPMVFESNMMRFRVDENRAVPSYVLRVLNSPICKKQFLGSAKRAVGQASISQGNLKAIRLPFPPMVEQQEMVNIFDTVIRKNQVHQRKHGALAALFRTLLHQLMTARLRIHNLDLSVLDAING